MKQAGRYKANFTKGGLMVPESRLVAAAAALKRMQEILRAPAPYGMVNDSESLIQTVEGANAASVQEHRRKALEEIEVQIRKVQVELDDAKASSDVRNQCLHPLQSLKRQVESQSSIAHIDQAPSAAVEMEDEALRKIEAAAEHAPTRSVGDDTPKPYLKRRVVKAAALAPKALLEAQEDVDAYLSKLRQALESAIDNNERVEIR